MAYELLSDMVWASPKFQAWHEVNAVASRDSSSTELFRGQIGASVLLWENMDHDQGVFLCNTPINIVYSQCRVAVKPKYWSVCPKIGFTLLISTNFITIKVFTRQTNKWRLSLWEKPFLACGLSNRDASDVVGSSSIGLQEQLPLAFPWWNHWFTDNWWNTLSFEIPVPNHCKYPERKKYHMKSAYRIARIVPKLAHIYG